MSVQVAVVGATGRLGQVVCEVVEATEGFDLHASLGSHSSLDELQGSDLVIDVSLPGVSESVVDQALHFGAKVLVGTSGWDADRLHRLDKKLADAPGAAVLVVPNFSVGSVVATALAEKGAQFFRSIEIIETHHQDKVDSPSGTARRTAERLAAIRDERGGTDTPHSNQTARGETIQGNPRAFAASGGRRGKTRSRLRRSRRITHHHPTTPSRPMPTATGSRSRSMG